LNLNKAPPVWLDLSQQELDAAYDQAVWAPNMDAVIARLADKSNQARARLGDPQQRAYGEQQDERLDIYRAEGSGRPVMIFVHGGSWRVGNAASNAFAAGMFVDAGIHFVVPDFSPVDAFSGDLAGMIDQLRRAVAWVYEHAADFGGDAGNIYLTGFSSGGHLAGVLLTLEWPSYGQPADIIKGALLCSGMYDLEPVALSFRREFLDLAPDSIAALSPLANVARINVPVIVAIGTHESPEFRRQAQEFTRELAAAGKTVQAVEVAGHNHFEIIEALASRDSPLSRTVLALIG
jgi:arylformamidase